MITKLIILITAQTLRSRVPNHTPLRWPSVEYWFL